MLRIGDDHEWARSLVADIPRPWGAHLLNAWEKRRSSFNRAKVTAEGTARRIANEWIREKAAMLVPVNDRLPLDASDHDVCSQAWAMAEHCRVKLLKIEAEQQHAPTADFLDCCRAAGVGGDIDDAGLDHREQRQRLAAICEAAGIAAPEETRYEDQPAVRRMVAAHWWRGRLRKVHAQAVEAGAINLALVSRGRQCYVSDVSVQARLRQNARNAATLEATKAKNLETEQVFTLAELAAKGPANAAIKRTELMTRINGFERIAIAAGHAGLFATITCPSKMHRFTTAYGGRAVENRKWDGTLPGAAQKYLTKVWAKIRAALARGSKKEKRPPVSLYGFRIAEPQHDGTPHWHCLFFYAKEHDAHVRAVVRRYALEMDGNEPGAQAKRVDFKTMDPAIGTAAGYIAKYVAKNIDGYRLEKDLEGNDSLETSQRVEAWATRWRIRQFQQIGGPPVTVWRELRRVESVPADAPAFVVKAHNAVNKVAVFEGRDSASVAWNHYVEAQGGVACGRNYRVRLATVPGDAVGRYGESGAPKTVGVTYHEAYKVRDAIGNWIDVRPMQTIVESKRYTWEIMRKSSARTFGSVRAASCISSFAGTAAGHIDRGLKGLDVGFKRAQRAPWTCVNNCTEGGGDGEQWADADVLGGRESEDLRGAGGGGRTAQDVRRAYADRKGGGGEANSGGAAAGRSGRSTLMQ
ncbi:replication endonuclease [Trinickia symbiotica]|uniref:Replication endonuclease n=1 Tax=Trinickia symbiotica TaxID=863227 RepID=A0A2N7XAB0_9BURK|nr:replication endonuclease [Trinickia symbiotica]PMS38482.1 replication endonuclease [Trinickia symbiotica]